MLKLLLRFTALWVLLALLGGGTAQATHLLGGEMNYRYLDANGPAAAPFRYEVTVMVYVNTTSPATPNGQGRPDVEVWFYNKSQNGARIPLNTINTTTPSPGGNLRIVRTSYAFITPPTPGGCSIPGGNVPVTLAKYTGIVNLPLSFEGYYAVYTDNARNVDVNNISNPGQTNMTLYTEMAPPLIPNVSPVFSDTAVVVVCQGDTSIVVNNAFDADGDRLIYTFGTPFQGQPTTTPFAPPPAPITYAPNFSLLLPFGPGTGSYATLNASTGIARYAAPAIGKYVVAVDVKEYRRINGTEVLVGTTRRDVQLVSRTCNPNRSPQFTAATLANRTFTVEEGQTLSFNIAATDADGNSINLRANSALLDGAGNYNATFAGQPGVLSGTGTGTVTVTGTAGSVSAPFVFTPRCGDGRPTPYDVAITATDVACGAKTVAEVFQIIVNRAAAPTGLAGDTIVCDATQIRTYTASGPAPAGGYSWRVRGGTIQGASNGASVQVRWNGTGQGRVTVRNVSAFGCQSDSVSRTINLRPASNLAVTSPLTTICAGQSTTLTATGGTTYVWTGGPAPVTGPSITVSPTQTTTYSVTSGDGLCSATRTITVTVNPVAQARAGDDVETCSGEPTQIGTAALAGYSYQWSPASGLSSATAAQPTVTLTNTTNALVTQRYIVTATTGQGCQARDTVVVTIRPAADARAGTDATVCTDQPTQIGAAALAGYSYQWSPSTGLSSTTTAQPTVTLNNPSTTAVLAQQYILTVTNSFGCLDRDTVIVRVNPTVVAAAGTNRRVCSGEATTLGAAAVAGYSYQWSPATGLSSTTSAQPVFTQVLAPNSAPQTLTYTLTVTSAQRCTATSQVVITLNPAASVNAGPDAAICSGRSVQIGTAALTGYAYQWSPATGLSSATAAQPTVTLTNPTAAALLQQYILTARTPEGCTRNDTVLVRVNPRPAADTVRGPASVCPTVQGVTYSIRSPRGAAYQWLVSGGTIVSGQGTTTITVNWGVANNAATVRAFRFDAVTGCSSDTTIFPVRINQVLATQRPTGPLRVCQNTGPQTYQIPTPTNGSTYGWLIIGGTQVSTAGGSVTVNWTTAGIGKIVATESSNPSGGRCLGTSDTLYVTVLPTPVAQQIGGQARYCANATGTYSVPNAATGSTFRWTLNGAAVPNASTGTVTLTGLTPGTYTLTATETNASGCAGPAATRQFTVDPLPVAPGVTGPRSVCPEGLNGVTYTIGGAAASSTFQWTVTGGTVVSGQNTGTVQVNFSPTATTRSIVVTETSQFGCAGPATTIALPLDNATVALRTASVDLASDQKITLALNVADRSNNANQVRVLRRPAGSTAAFAQVATVANSAATYDDTSVDADASAYDYRLELLNSCGTVLNSTAHTTVRLEVTGSQPGQGRQEGSVDLRWNAYAGFPVARYEVYRTADNGTAELVATVAAGTSPSYTTSFTSSAAGFDQRFRIKVVGTATGVQSWSNETGLRFANPLDFYNVMTPNGDGLNDVFFIRNVQLYPGNTIAIYNRWGRELYRTKDYRNTWGGDAQPAGTYYFLFTEASGKVTKGWFEIVK